MPVQGDIRDLYAYYRLGNHEQTVVKVKTKVFAKEEVFFEGYMGWSFEDCQFSERFHFGVEGNRLAEDTRGTPENLDPFPPYGHNNLHFKGCTFRSFFQIEDNCVVVFKDCEFLQLDNETEEDKRRYEVNRNCRVEFHDCTFRCDSYVQSNTEAKFFNCTFEECQEIKLEVSGQSTATVHGGSAGDPTLGAWLRVTSGSDVVLDSLSGIVKSESPAVSVSGRSKCRLYNIGGIQGGQPTAVEVAGQSRLEARTIGEWKSAQGKTLTVADSEVFIYGVGRMQGADICMDATAGIIRAWDVQEVEGQGHPCVQATGGSEITMRSCVKVESQGKEAFKISDSDLNLSDIATISCSFNAAVECSGEGEAFLRHIGIINNSAEDGVTVKEGYTLHMTSVEQVTAQRDALVCESGGTIDDYSGVMREGQRYGAYIHGSGHLNLRGLEDRLYGVEIGLHVNVGSYDLRDLVKVESATKAMVLTSGRGFVSALDEVTSPQDAVTVTDSSGPTEWQDVTKITSDGGKALSINGAAGQLKMVSIGEITAPADVAIALNTSDASLWFNQIPRIESTAASAISGTLGENSFAELGDIELVNSPAASAVQLSVDGELRLKDVIEITSPAATAVQLSVSETGQVQILRGEKVESAAGSAIGGSCSGELVVRGTQELISASSAAVGISGGEEKTHIELAKITSITSGAGDGVAVSGNMGATILRRIASIESGSGNGVSLSGNSSGRADIVDCPQIQGGAGVGVSLTDIQLARLRCFGSRGTVQGSSTGLAVQNTTLELASYASIQGGSVGVSVDNSNGHRTVSLEDVSSIVGGTALSAQGGELRVVNCPSIAISSFNDVRLTLLQSTITGTISFQDTIADITKATLSGACTVTDSGLKLLLATISGAVTASGSALFAQNSDLSTVTLSNSASLIGMSCSMSEPAGDGSAILLDSGVAAQAASLVSSLINLDGGKGKTVITAQNGSGTGSYILCDGPTQTRGAAAEIADEAPLINHN